MIALMDQGIAAVLGAGVGIAGTLGSALLGYATARHQARDQGRVDHGFRLRDERKEAYLAFLEVEERLAILFREIRFALCADEDSIPDWLYIETREDAVSADLVELSRRRTRVTLAGPRGVDAGAAALCAVFSSAARYVGGLSGDDELIARSQPRLDALSCEIETARQEFADAVQLVLAKPPL
ncbi:hypothetical protein [Streptomyces sp. MMG1121]|uniref:hypothetical protein n=1 Tax=Streptomyces sp. MMG1121 TaxID=1415544 RepID=UPI0006AEE73A|nr:hypothetical protein [Streptomyces sp. MMG1121]KOV59139.1 hypothetical protein ADK64_33695 [Streptomyces sp. MMG1121]